MSWLLNAPLINIRTVFLQFTVKSGGRSVGTKERDKSLGRTQSKSTAPRHKSLDVRGALELHYNRTREIPWLRTVRAT